MLRAITVEYTVLGSLDGTTAAPVLDVSHLDVLSDPDQIYRPDPIENLGVIDPDLAFPNAGSMGPRAATFVWVDGGGSVGAAGAGIFVAAVLSDGTRIDQLRAIDLDGEQGVYSARGVFIPQGSVLRLGDMTAAAGSPILMQITFLVPETIEDFAELLALTEGTSSAPLDFTPYGLRIVGLNPAQLTGSVNTGVPLFADPLPTKGDFGIDLSEWLVIESNDEDGTSFRITKPGIYQASASMFVGGGATRALVLSLDATGLQLQDALDAPNSDPSTLVQERESDAAGMGISATSPPFALSQAFIDLGSGVFRPLVHEDGVAIVPAEFVLYLRRISPFVVPVA